MNFSISDLKNRIGRKLHGSTINKLPGNFNDLVSEAASNLLLKIDPVETKRIATLSNALYDDVYNYVIPSDLKSDKIVDIRPQVKRVVGDNFQHQYPKEFDSYKSDKTFTIERDGTVRTLRISNSGHPGKLLAGYNSATADGTWAAGGDATNLTADGLNYITGAGSLNFDVASAGSAAYLENSTFTAVDLSEWEDQAAGFVWVYIPTAANVTNCILRWGSSSSDYWSVTVTQQHDQTSFRSGWNLLRFDWSSASETGSPSSSAIDYLRFTVTYDGTAGTDYRLDSIMFRLGELYEIVYYSSYLFRDTSGTWLESPTATDDSDLVNLDSESINLLVYEMLYLAAQEIQGEDASFDVGFWEQRRNDAWMTYKSHHKTETIKKQTRYYRYG